MPITRSCMQPLIAPLSVSPIDGRPAFFPTSLYASGEQGFLGVVDPAYLRQNSNGTGAVAVGDPVGYWQDLSGRANHLTQATAGSRPTLRQTAGGLYYLDPDGVDDFLSCNLALSAYPMTLAVAAQADADVDGGAISLMNASAVYKQINKTSTVNRWAATDRNASAIGDGMTVGTNATPHVMLADFRTATVELRMDGTSDGTTANTNAFGTSTTLYVGKTRDTGLPFDGRIFGVVAIARTLTTTERANVERYLAARAGIAI